MQSGSVQGLGQLALQNTVNGSTQVTNLGLLAFANTLYANQLGSGTFPVGVIYAGTVLLSQLGSGQLPVGVVYAGTLNANQINGGDFTGKTFTGGSFVGAFFTGSTDISIPGSVALRTNYAKFEVSAVFDKGLYVGDPVNQDNSAAGREGLRCQVGYNVELLGSYMTLNSRDAANRATFWAEASGSNGNNHAIRGIRRNVKNGTIQSSGIVGQNGGFAFYAETFQGSTGYGPFTAGHEALIPKETAADVGMVLDDDELIAARDLGNTLLTTKPSSSARSPRSAGVLVSRRPLRDGVPAALIKEYREEGEGEDKTITPVLVDEWDDLCERYDLVVMNALGDGQVLACGRNGDIEAGDWLCSSDMPGIAQRQGDDVFRNYTLAKSRVGVTFDYPDQVKLVPLFYKCG
ncbi:hypothetical protein A2G96_08020 [Cupriavidus nantongensis]|uniref:Uncharacterized protein n=1 Tax=Cupriavidus nantongensis TaxID=1796606 RepID=A0A142JHX3_9BURK|nr:hypothetical protein A2G96_08020 [Cupriavidus nantongensis]